MTPEQMTPTEKDYSLSQWVLQSVPALGLFVVIAGVVVHVAAGVGRAEVVRAGLVIFTIQTSAVILMFWARQFWQRTADLRLGFFLSGVYLIALVPVLEHYAARWGLVAPQNTLRDAVIITFITFGCLLLSWWRWHRKARRPVAPDNLRSISLIDAEERALPEDRARGS